MVFWKTMFFFKSNVFDTTSHVIYFDYKAYAFYQNKHYSCFHNTIPRRSQSYRPCYSRTLIQPLFSTLKLFLFSCRKSLRFLARIFWNCAFFPWNMREKRKTQTKNYHWVSYTGRIFTRHYQHLNVFIIIYFITLYLVVC